MVVVVELVQTYRLIYIYIASVPNQFIEPRGHTADQQFQKFENFLETIFKFFFQNRTSGGLKPPNTKFHGD